MLLLNMNEGYGTVKGVVECDDVLEVVHYKEKRQSRLLWGMSCNFAADPSHYNPLV